ASLSGTMLVVGASVARHQRIPNAGSGAAPRMRPAAAADPIDAPSGAHPAGSIQLVTQCTSWTSDWPRGNRNNPRYRQATMDSVSRLLTGPRGGSGSAAKAARTCHAPATRTSTVVGA